MSFTSRFNRIFSRNSKNTATTELATSAGGSVEQAANATIFDDLTKLNPDAHTTTFDELAKLNPDVGSTTTYDSLAGEVPFAGAQLESVETRQADSLAVEPLDASLAKHSESVVSGKANLEPARPELMEVGEKSAAPAAERIRRFFQTDLRIKQELIDLQPDASSEDSEATRMDYVEDAYKTLHDMKRNFLRINQDFGGAYSKEHLEKFFQRQEDKFMLGSYDYGVTKDIYRHVFTDMRPSFVQEVREKHYGYSLFGGGVVTLIPKAETVNELLHAYHSNIINSNGILQSVPEVDHRELENGTIVSLRGDETGLSKSLFEAIPDGLDIGKTDIVAIDDHIMVMVRGSGHALAIDCDYDKERPEEIYVRYNIPKICNETMVKALPGLNSYSEAGAGGAFMTSRNDFGTKVADFIGKVPQDKDMVLGSYIKPAENE